MNYSVVEKDTYFDVDDGEGPFRIEKQGLDPVVLAKLREDGARAQGLATGGVVNLPFAPGILDLSSASTERKKYEGVPLEDLEAVTDRVAAQSRAMGKGLRNATSPQFREALEIEQARESRKDENADGQRTTLKLEPVVIPKPELTQEGLVAFDSVLGGTGDAIPQTQDGVIPVDVLALLLRTKRGQPDDGSSLWGLANGNRASVQAVIDGLAREQGVPSIPVFGEGFNESLATVGQKTRESAQQIQDLRAGAQGFADGGQVQYLNSEGIVRNADGSVSDPSDPAARAIVDEYIAAYGPPAGYDARESLPANVVPALSTPPPADAGVLPVAPHTTLGERTPIPVNFTGPPVPLAGDAQQYTPDWLAEAAARPAPGDPGYDTRNPLARFADGMGRAVANRWLETAPNPAAPTTEKDQPVPTDTTVPEIDPNAPLAGAKSGFGASVYGSETSIPAMGAPKTFGADPEIAAAAKEARDALAVKSSLEDYAAQEQAALELQKADIERRAFADYTRELDAHKASTARLEDDIRASRIDPSRLYHDMNTGRQVAATIGILLGGVGQGLRGGGGNVALQMLDKAVERDIIAQQEDLATKKSMLSYYLQKGHGIETAYKLAKASALDVVAAQLESVAKRSAGAKGAQDALVLAANIRSKAAQDAQQSIAARTDAHYKPLLAESQIAANQATRMAAGASMRVAAGAQMKAQESDGAMRRLYAAEGKYGDELLVDPKVRAATVQLSNGKRALARDETIANKIREAQAGRDNVVAVVGRLRDLHEKYGREMLPSGEAQAVKNLLTIDINSGSGLGALDKGTKELLEHLVTNPTDIFQIDSNFKGRLKAVEDFVNNRTFNIENAGLFRQRIAPGGSRVAAGEGQ